MIDFMIRLLPRSQPSLSEASPRDAGELAALHTVSFRHGWSESEFSRFLLEQNVLAHRAMIARTIAGFIVSRYAADEAEILSIAVAPRRRQRGVAGRLLDLHLRSLAGLGVNSVFLEVDEDNRPARRLYARAGFDEVGRRESYYPHGEAGAHAALVLRRDLA